MARYLLTRKRSNFLDIEGVLLWLCECQHYSSSFSTHKEKIFDKIPIYYQYSIDSVDPICRETYPFATEIACDSNPVDIFVLDSDGNEYYPLTLTPVNQDPRTHLKPSKNRSTIHFNTFSAHTAGL